MNKLIDKLVVFILCMVSYIQYKYDLYIVVPVICAILESAFLSYFDSDIVKLIAFIIYCILCIVFPVFIFFLPLICYDVFFSKWKVAMLLIMVPIGNGIVNLPLFTSMSIILFVFLTYLIKWRTIALEKLKSDYIALRDTTKEFALQLESKNKELMEKQDYEVNLATLNERNRIARDIHDSVGHLLSNSILQTGALMAICKDIAVYEKLDVLKSTLVQGMDSIRESIHDLYEESIDLYTEAKTLVDNFHFCEISMEYDMGGNPDKKIKYTLLAVLKETLSNIIRHSNATGVLITLREHPAFYQMIIKDNGTKKSASSEGIGLKNITQRVESLKGIVNIGFDNGFTVFVSIPKER